MKNFNTYASFKKYLNSQKHLLDITDFDELYEKTYSIISTCTIRDNEINAQHVKKCVYLVVMFYAINNRLWITKQDYIVTKHFIDMNVSFESYDAIDKNVISKYQRLLKNGHYDIDKSEYEFLNEVVCNIFSKFSDNYTINFVDLLIFYLFDI